MADESKKVMVIEDDRFLSTLVKARLEKEGFVVVQAFDGEEALETLRRDSPPNLIILDLIMPKVTGFELLQTVSITPGLATIPVDHPQ